MNEQEMFLKNCKCYCCGIVLVIFRTLILAFSQSNIILYTAAGTVDVFGIVPFLTKSGDFFIFLPVKILTLICLSTELFASFASTQSFNFVLFLPFESSELKKN